MFIADPLILTKIKVYCQSINTNKNDIQNNFKLKI